MKIKKGDKIIVNSGEDKGKSGTIEKLFPLQERVLVGGINLYKKHMKPREGKPGGIIDIPRPLPISKVTLICPKCSRPVRVGYQVTGKEKIRICKKCKNKI